MKKIKDLEIKPILFIILIISIFLIGITLAYFYNRGTFENKFKSSAYNVELNEEFNNNWGKKEVNITNKDETPIILRINYNEIWVEKKQTNLSKNQIDNNPNNGSCRTKISSNETNKYTLSNIIDGEEVVTKSWTSTWNDFIEGNDGWYYYNKILYANESIKILENISLRNDLVSSSNCYEDYNNYEYELSFNYEAIQADISAVKDIWGYDITLNGGYILWPF